MSKRGRQLGIAIELPKEARGVNTKTTSGHQWMLDRSLGKRSSHQHDKINVSRRRDHNDLINTLYHRLSNKFASSSSQSKASIAAH